MPNAQSPAPTASELPDPLARNAHWRTFQWLLQVVFCFWLRYRARGLEHLPREGGGLFLINHQSFLDPLLIGLPLKRPISFLARDSLFQAPVVGWLLRNMYAIPINRQAASTSSLREAIRRLKRGFFVGIFPEGTRTETGEIGELKPGFLALMRRADVPVYPVGIAGAFQAYPRGAWFVRPVKVRVVFGEPLTAEELACFNSSQERELLTFIRERMQDCQKTAETWRNGGR